MITISSINFSVIVFHNSKPAIAMVSILPGYFSGSFLFTSRQKRGPREILVKSIEITGSFHHYGILLLKKLRQAIFHATVNCVGEIKFRLIFKEIASF